MLVQAIIRPSVLCKHVLDGAHTGHSYQQRQIHTLFFNAGLLLGAVLLGQLMLKTKFGQLLLALRDKKERVRFSEIGRASCRERV